jgi:uracil phosphoribosyltransferase
MGCRGVIPQKNRKNIKNSTAMKIIDLNESNSVLNQFVSEIRNVEVQNDRLRFRRNIERIGEIMAYEMSKAFTTSC